VTDCTYDSNMEAKYLTSQSLLHYLNFRNVLVKLSAQILIG